MGGVADIDSLHNRAIRGRSWGYIACSLYDSGRGDDIERYLFEDEGLQVGLNYPSIIFIRA